MWSTRLFLCVTGSQTCCPIPSHLMAFAIHTFDFPKPAVSPPGSLLSCFQREAKLLVQPVPSQPPSAAGGPPRPLLPSSTAPHLVEAIWRVIEVHMQQVAQPRQWHGAWWVAGSPALAPVHQVHQEQKDGRSHGQCLQCVLSQQPHACLVAYLIALRTCTSYLGPCRILLVCHGTVNCLVCSLIKDLRLPFAL
jgi:hypothetical protein